MSTMYLLLKQAASEVPEKPYVITESASHSYQDFLKSVNRLSVGLTDLGIQKGDHIAVFLPNGVEFLYTMFALNRIGSIIVPANTALQAEELT